LSTLLLQQQTHEIKEDNNEGNTRFELSPLADEKVEMIDVSSCPLTDGLRPDYINCILAAKEGMKTA
jgi:hypothetical protein